MTVNNFYSIPFMENFSYMHLIYVIHFELNTLMKYITFQEIVDTR